MAHLPFAKRTQMSKLYSKGVVAMRCTLREMSQGEQVTPLAAMRNGGVTTSLTVINDVSAKPEHGLQGPVPRLWSESARPWIRFLAMTGGGRRTVESCRPQGAPWVCAKARFCGRACNCHTQCSQPAMPDVCSREVGRTAGNLQHHGSDHWGWAVTGPKVETRGQLSADLS